jgi:hypothetical protein
MALSLGPTHFCSGRAAAFVPTPPFNMDVAIFGQARVFAPVFDGLWKSGRHQPNTPGLSPTKAWRRGGHGVLDGGWFSLVGWHANVPVLVPKKRGDFPYPEVPFERFPLTPALSLGKSENGRLVVGPKRQRTARTPGR